MPPDRPPPTKDKSMATRVPFVTEMSFEYGRAEQVAPLIRRVIARNPSPFTFHGTGTYIVGKGRVAVIDPGPDLAEHVDALKKALTGETVTHIVITHTHRDHSPAACALQEATGAPTLGFGPHGSGRPEAGGDVEEGADHDFKPDVRVRDGETVAGAGWTLTAVHTPGHTSNHLCFALAEEAALFSGDHVMGWSTTVVSPPDGDMQAYMPSVERLAARGDSVLWPTHGPPIRDPERHLAALLAHRRDREVEIVRCLENGLTSIPEMVETMYADVGRHLHKAAGRSVHAHLIHLVETGRATCAGAPTADASYGPA
jgi:glyoxylase-like metal-dependent hydrolase (beta-lactamase superfamily II)